VSDHPYLLGARRPRVLAHRGLVTADAAAVGVAENSARAVADAVSAGAQFVESDCHLTRDGVVVLFHDDNLRRVLGDPRTLLEVDVAELRALMAPRGALITLEEALERFPSTRFNIDVKADAATAAVGPIIAPHTDRVLLTAFADRRRRAATAAVMQAGARRRPAASPGSMTVLRVLVAVWLGSRRLLARALRDIDALQIPERQGPVRVLTPRLISMAHRAGVEVHVWTINEVDAMRRLADAGVDGIVTDRADVALTLFEERP
jgi:glycerophosphoryl diester phosphodiesterase